MTASVPASNRLSQKEEDMIDVVVLVSMARTRVSSLEASPQHAEWHIGTLRALLNAIEALCLKTLGEAEGGTDGGSGDEDSLCGLPCGALPRGKFPKDAKWTRKALETLGIPTTKKSVRGGHQLFVDIGNLPSDTKAALVLPPETIEEANTNDPAACERYSAAPRKARERAHQKFEAVWMVHEALLEGTSKGLAIAEAARQTGLSSSTISRALALVASKPRGEWVPALLPAWKPGGRKAEIAPDAWRYFHGLMTDAAPSRPLKKAWQRTAQVAAGNDWAWPSYTAVRNEWRREIDLVEQALDAILRKVIPDLEYLP